MDLCRTPSASGASPRLTGWMVAVLGAWAVSACQAQQAPGAAVGSRLDEAQLQQRITTAIGGAACQQQADCRTLAVGAKACGGPARWVAWSATQSDGVQLQAWADELAARQRQRQAAEGQMSNCSVVPDPGAVCRAGQCVVSQGASAR